MFLFTHIEKCAGTSFKSELELTFLDMFMCPKTYTGVII
jgi:hypothetical protein